MAFVPAYILILFFLILLDYGAGLMIARSQAPTRHLWLVLSIVGNVTMLGFYKYFNFLDQNLVALAQWIGFDYTGSQMNIVLPIGLSFHTFQSMSYVFEVYRGRQPAERDLLVYSLYVLFFPQMVAGPIERPQNLLVQLHHTRPFDHERAVSGLVTMAIGFFKKLVIADRFAIVVNTVVQQSGDAFEHRSGDRVVLLRISDLLRLRGLLGYCDRCRAHHGLRLDERISSDPTRPVQFRISGSGGISRFRAGFVTISTSRLAVTASRGCLYPVI